MKITDKNEINNLISEPAVSNDEVIKSKKAGFTLVELVVVSAVIAILVAFSAGSMASVNRRKATRVGKIIDSELTTLASNAYSREGYWRLKFAYDEEEECYVVTQQYNVSDGVSDDKWEDFSRTVLASSVDMSFGGDKYDKANSGDTYYVAVSREKGCYLTDGLFEGYFCDNIYVHSAAKVVTIHMSLESGGHRVVD